MTPCGQRSRGLTRTRHSGPMTSAIDPAPAQHQLPDPVPAQHQTPDPLSAQRQTAQHRGGLPVRTTSGPPAAEPGGSLVESDPERAAGNEPEFDTRRPFTRADAIAAGVKPGLFRGSRFRRLFRGVYIDSGVPVTTSRSGRSRLCCSTRRPPLPAVRVPARCGGCPCLHSPRNTSASSPRRTGAPGKVCVATSPVPGCVWREFGEFGCRRCSTPLSPLRRASA